MADLKQKLADLPASPGVYLYKNRSGKIIYVGKAAVLRNRVKQYFQESRPKDAKTSLLVSDIEDIDWLEVGSEIEALFLESELIKRYKPKYNIDLKDDKHYQYVRVDLKSPHPTVKIVRRPLDDGATYVGPFVEGIRVALRLLRRIFPYDVTIPNASSAHRSKLLSDIGLSPGLEEGRINLNDYRKNLRRLVRYLNGGHQQLVKKLSREMKTAARAKDFEKAARLRDQISSLARLQSQIIFSDKELFDITKDQALDGLVRLINQYRPPASAIGNLRRIEGYDISHMSGTNNVASMVVFINGVSDKGQYRKFKMRLAGNDDFAHMREVISRRFSGRNLEQWPKPDLLLIDGGKGQVTAALEALQGLKLTLPVIGLAKRFETIILPIDQSNGFKEIDLPSDSPVIKLLQRIRDESHRFVRNYHSTLKIKGQRQSALDDIPGIGPATRKKLIRHFGSLRALASIKETELAQVVGADKASKIVSYMQLAGRKDVGK